MAGWKSSTTLLVCLVALACTDAAQARLNFLRDLLWSSLTAPAASGAVAQSACSPQQVYPAASMGWAGCHWLAQRALKLLDQ